MSLKKSDLEIIYNLKWKNGPSINGGVKESMIGVYDIPATTLNWEVFKSYLLKNSGTTGNDVKISYIMDSGKEYPIQSQTDFQVALYAFRRKARAGEIINLKLERISDQPNHKNLRHSNDVETQFDNNEQASFISTTCCANGTLGDTPPDWFLASLMHLKKEITEEVTATVSSIVSTALANVKTQVVPPPVPCSHHHSRKVKSEKKLRKLTPNLVEGSGKSESKDFIKSLKLDSKLERLERKTNKYKEKRSMLFGAAKSSDSEAGHSSSRSRSQDKEGKEKKMDAQPTKIQDFTPHMLGGEIYLHQWEVKNSGELAWTHKTYLQYTWGSKALEPLEKTITVPHLKPGEIGTISARLQVPNDPGRYECYWQFMHKGRRFGHWLGAQLIVDPFDLKGNRSVLETSTRNIEFEDDAAVSSAPEASEVVKQYPLPEGRVEEIISSIRESNPELADRALRFNEKTRHRLCQAYQEFLSDSETESNQDNQSVTSVEGSNNSSSKSLKEEYVMVPSCFRIDNLEAEKNEHILVDIDTPSTSGLPALDAEKSEKSEQLQEKAENPKPQEKKISENGADNNNNNNEKDGLRFSTSSQQSFITNSQIISTNNEKIAEGNQQIVTKNEANNSVEITANQAVDNEKNSASGDSDYEVTLLEVEEDGKPVKQGVTKIKKGNKKDGFVFIKFNNAQPEDQMLHLPKTLLNCDLVQVIDNVEKAKISEQIKPSTSEQSPKIPEDAIPPKQKFNIQVVVDVKDKPEQKDKGVLLDLSVSGSENSTAEAQKPAIPLEFRHENRENVQNGGVPEDVVQAAAVADEFMSHCSAAGSTFSDATQQNKRLFVFPTDCPGYEVVYPVLDHDETGEPMIYSQYYPSGEQRLDGFFPEQQHLDATIAYPQYTYDVPNYQQTPSHLRPTEPFVRPSTEQNSTTSQPGDTAARQTQPNGNEDRQSRATEETARRQPSQQTTSQPGSAAPQPQQKGNNDRQNRKSTGAPAGAQEAPAQEAPTRAQEMAGQIHILPEGIVTGAVSVASSAINTARNVMDMFRPQAPGRWVNGHWVSNHAQTPREANLQALHEMGFWNRDLNATLLARFNDDLNRVVAELVQ